MQRRELITILTATVATAPEAVAQHQHEAAPATRPAEYQPRFFDAAQYEAIGLLCDIILPADEHSPGAAAVRVPFYIDTVLHHADATTQAAWRAGLAATERAAQSRFQRTFISCDAAQQEQVVAMMARNEDKPATPLEEFFGPLKRLTVEAYCHSDEAMKGLFRYRGNTAVAGFPGCTHPEHQAERA